MDACRYVVRDAAHDGLARDTPGPVRAGAGTGGSLARRRAEERAHRTRLPRQSTPMNRIAPGCGSRSGGFGQRFGRWRRSARRSEGFALTPHRATQEIVVLAPPVEEPHAAVLALSSPMASPGRARRWRSRLAPARAPCSGRSMRLRAPARCSPSAAVARAAG